MLEINVKKIDERISVRGDKKEIEKLASFVSSAKDESGHTWECSVASCGFDNVNGSIEIPVQLLKNSKDNCSVIETLLTLIKTNPQAVTERTHLLLQYWAYETNVIRDGKSLIQPTVRELETAAYAHNQPRSQAELEKWAQRFHQQLTSSVVLIDLFDKFKHYSFVPPLQELFNFLEKTTIASMKFSPLYHQKTVFFSPIYPSNWSLERFIVSLKKLESSSNSDSNNAFSPARTMGEIGFLPTRNTKESEQQKNVNMTPPGGWW